MISFNLRCGKDHVFEAWFKDGKSFDRQARQGKVACPVCGNSKVEKAPMAPNIASGVSRKSGGADGGRKSEVAVQAAAYHEALKKLRSEVEKNCDYVGDKFAEEARKIHYNESEQRNIYGETTDQEAQALHEEGVEFARIPWPTRQDS
jgi:hypothetical protein